MKSWQDAVFHLGCKGTHLHWARTPRQRATRRFHKPPTAWPFKEKRPSLWERRCPRPGTSDKHLRRPVDIAIGQRKILWLQNCNNVSKGNALRKWRPVVVVRKKLSEVYWLWAQHDLCVEAKLTCAHCREAQRTLFQPKPSLHLHQFLKSTKGYTFPATYLQVPNSWETMNGATTSSPRILCFLFLSMEVHFSQKSPPFDQTSTPRKGNLNTKAWLLSLNLSWICIVFTGLGTHHLGFVALSDWPVQSLSHLGGFAFGFHPSLYCLCWRLNSQGSKSTIRSTLAP